MESSINKARRIIRDADSLRRKIRAAEEALKTLRAGGLMLKVGTLEIPSELRAAVIHGIELEVDKWRAEADRLESRVITQ